MIWYVRVIKIYYVYIDYFFFWMEVDFGKNEKLLLICWYIYIYVCYVIVMINVIVCKIWWKFFKVYNCWK